MMLHATALASTCFTCFVFDNLTERFIRIILEVLGQDLQLTIAEQCLVDQPKDSLSALDSVEPLTNPLWHAVFRAVSWVVAGFLTEKSQAGPRPVSVSPVG